MNNFYPTHGLPADTWCVVCRKEYGTYGEKPKDWWLVQLKKGQAYVPICGECKGKTK